MQTTSRLQATAAPSWRRCGATVVIGLCLAALAARRALSSKEFIAFLERKSAIEAQAGLADAAFATLMRAAEEYTNVDSAAATALAYCERLDRLASTLPPAQACASLLELQRDSQAIDHRGSALAACIRPSAAALDTDPAQAARAAREALALAESHQTTALLPAELWLHAGRDLAAQGRAAQAAKVAARGRDWLRRTASLELPAHLRDAFVHRQPLHLQLLALADAPATQT